MNTNETKHIETDGIGIVMDQVGNLRPGSLLAIGGPVGSGKSSLAIGAAIHLAKNPGNRVLLVSLESTEECLVRRIVSVVNRASEHDISSYGKDAIKAAVEKACAVNMGLVFPASPSIRGIQKQIADCNSVDRPVTHVLIDYVELMDDQSATGSDRVKTLLAALKKVATESGVVLMAVTFAPPDISSVDVSVWIDPVGDIAPGSTDREVAISVTHRDESDHHATVTGLLFRMDQHRFEEMSRVET